MELGNSILNIIAFLGSIWSLILVLVIVGQINKHMHRGRSIGGAILATIGSWVGGALVSTIAFWAVFSLATPKLENQAADYADDSNAGKVFYTCTQDLLHCIPSNGQNTTSQPSYFPGDSQPQVQPENPVAPSDQSAPPAADGSQPSPQQPVQPVAPSYSGPPSPTLFQTDEKVRACTFVQILTTITGLSGDAIQTPAKGYLPAGSKWTISSPNWWNHTMKPGENESWVLTPIGYENVITFDITGDMARALGGKINLFQNRKAVTITGTGQLPQACWPQNLNPIP